MQMLLADAKVRARSHHRLGIDQLTNGRESPRQGLPALGITVPIR